VKASLHRLRAERGQALVELALALPVLMFIIFGAIELARGVNYWLDANHVANEGARWAAVNRLPSYTTVVGNQNIAATTAPQGADLRNYLGNELDQVSFPTSGRQVCVTLNPSTSPQIGDDVSVKVTLSWPLPLITSISGLFGLSPSRTSIPIHGDSTMRLEQLPSYLSVGSCP
jgi:Flp pilus assembly protein TadG